MSFIHKLLFLLVLGMVGTNLWGQNLVKGKIIDARTKEPIPGATIRCTEANCTCGCTTGQSGEFNIHCRGCNELTVSSVGYSTTIFSPLSTGITISMLPIATEMQEVIMSANRGEGQKRSEAPIAIGIVSSKTIQDTKPTSVEQVLNKISGVNMVNLGNEQHQMSIRQPMTTKSLFLYLEDGIPIRTSGLFNHNALLEINMAAAKSIEVIKGPSSSLYGSEAIGGVVNFITTAPANIPVMKIGVQGNNIGYKRTDLITSGKINNWGFSLSGYYAEKKDSYLEYTDFNKGIITARIDYRFSDKTDLTSSLTLLNYYSDMTGTIDSLMFAGKSFTNPQSFTYRKVNSIRYRSTLNQKWNENSKTSVSILLRNNSIEQNPAYRIKDDYHRQGNSFVGNKELAHGEINESSFHSYSLVGQHRRAFKWKSAVFISGMSVELSPSAYHSSYIRIRKDTITKKYTEYKTTDSILTNYNARLNNYAAFANFECTPLKRVRVVASLRYDFFNYDFVNHLKVSAFSGSRDTVNYFKKLSPKLGLIYSISAQTGFYANYSEGFVPPQVTELYTGVKVPDLHPAIFYNYEIGGWINLIKNKISADFSLYSLAGTNEIISVKQDDGSFANQNTGRTLHRGLEAGINIRAVKDFSWRWSGAWSKHEFVEYQEKGVNYSGRQMSNAPAWIWNTELWYKPRHVKNLRVGAELNHTGKYFVDPANSATYKGYTVLNMRIGYTIKGIEVWLNVLNVTNNYYSYITTKSTFGYSYQLAEPVNINTGLSFDFASLFKHKP
jgi:outer membrane receptor protein involved in Fe transport